MTSKEALEIIVRKHCVSNTDKEDEELEKCYKCVISDLEVLDIFKRGYGNTKENQFYTICESHPYCGGDLYIIDANYADFYPSRMELTKEEYDEIKEWLERKENRHD